MTNSEIKSSIRKIIDSIDNDNLLNKYYELISRMKDMKDGDLWKSLSRNEQDELIKIETDSRDEKNLISHHDMREKHKKWL